MGAVRRQASTSLPLLGSESTGSLQGVYRGSTGGLQRVYRGSTGGLQGVRGGRPARRFHFWAAGRDGESSTPGD
eukprot:850025-Prorocentrum_minimum.AAC.2